MNSFNQLLLFVCIAATSAVVLPQLNVIKQASFKYSYSCQSPPLRYQDCALFLTDKSVAMNAPELLYNGACGSNDYFEAMFAGSDFGVLTDIVGEDNQFFKDIPVVKGHTYAAVLARRNNRALFVFRVESYQRNGPLTISYAVKQYSVIESVTEAPGFSWTAPNQ
ncbi:hypothetical protein I4U23_014913 [Adineta vaga]|nr:hypothetical protein I4U23_014913 [Adineta vaga]